MEVPLVPVEPVVIALGAVALPLLEELLFKASANDEGADVPCFGRVVAGEPEGADEVLWMGKLVGAGPGSGANFALEPDVVEAPDAGAPPLPEAGLRPPPLEVGSEDEGEVGKPAGPVEPPNVPPVDPPGANFGVVGSEVGGCVGG